MDVKQTQAVVELVTTTGDETSEHAAMQSATTSGHVLAAIGGIVATLPQLLDMLNALPPQVQQSKYPQLALAILGGLAAICGIVRATAAKVAYINGRSLTKAASVNALGIAAAATPAPATAPALDEKVA